MVMKLTLLSIVLAASLVTALPREYSDVKKVAKFDLRSVKNVHGDFNAVHLGRMTKRGPADLGKSIGDVVDAALEREKGLGGESGYENPTGVATGSDTGAIDTVVSGAFDTDTGLAAGR